jgi:plasmid stabilization system protein ParE
LKVVWSPLAIQRAAEAAARRWLEGLFKTVDRLERFPHSGRVLPEIGLPEYREVLYGSHRVIHKVQKKTVAILTIRHSKQLFDSGEITDNPPR